MSKAEFMSMGEIIALYARMKQEQAQSKIVKIQVKESKSAQA